MKRLLPYFSFTGRTNRQRFWVTAVTIVVFYFLFALFAAALTRAPIVGILAGLVFFGVALVAFVAILANNARRLHDRAKSAWWLLFFQGAPVLFGVIGALASFGGDRGEAASVSELLSLPIAIWAFVELGCLKGTSGPNRYGADPLEPPMQEVFA